MKRKIISLAAVLMLAFSLAACGNISGSYIQPKVLSKDAKEIVNLFSGNLNIFEMKIDDNFKSYDIDIWEYIDGNWERGGFISTGKPTEEDLKNSSEEDWKISDKTVGIFFDENVISLYDITNSGVTAYSRKAVDIPTGSTGASYKSLDKKVKIIPGEDITLYSRCYHFGDSITSYSNFKEAECEAGYAITIRFYE